MFLKQEVQEEFEGWRISQDIIWEKHNGSASRSDRFNRVHEHAIHLYREDQKWEDVFNSPVYTLDAVKRSVYRRRGPSQFGKVNPSSYESHAGGKRLMRSVIFARSCHGYAINETQKPINILAPLIDYACPEEGRVLDPFMGSGSTLEVLLKTGRTGTGIEIREEQCEKAAKRLESIIANPILEF